ncbi:MAG TPA: amidase [Planctomycetaceae bacterium]|nr:amidase [Planctomycetaceae bacterium]
MHLRPPAAETIAGVARALRAREETCVAVVERCLAQIDAWEPEIHAWVSMDRDGARAQALELDRDIGAGHWRGTLHGIPIGIKDLVDIAGRPTTAGASWLSQNAEADALIVARLRAAGAIILGKTVTTQFACFDPPPTRNPWNLERTPGGSSSGSAAAVAIGMCLGAIGSQTGGSITRPASFCGVAGCKPTYGLVPLKGVYPVSPSLDHGGPIARTVEDLGIVLETLVSPMDRLAWRAGHAAAPGSAVEFAVWSASPLSPLSPFPEAKTVRLGRLRGMFAERADKTALTIFEQTLEKLSREGAKITDAILPPAFDDVLRCHRVIMTVEIAKHHREMFKQRADQYLPCIRGLIEEGLAVAPEEYARCKQHQLQLTHEMSAVFRDVDALVSPAALGPAPATDSTGDPAFNSPWSYTHLPTISFPIGLSLDGLPLAMQLVGNSYDEVTLFAAARWCERIALA